MSEFLTTLDGMIESTEEFIADAFAEQDEPDDHATSDFCKAHKDAPSPAVRQAFPSRPDLCEYPGCHRKKIKPTHFQTRLKDLNADRVRFDGRSLECYGALLDGTTAWSLVHTGPLTVALVVDGGMWTDPTVYGPFASEHDARQAMHDQAGDDVEIVYVALAPNA